MIELISTYVVNLVHLPKWIIQLICSLTPQQMFIVQYDPLPAGHSFLCHTNLGAQILIDADRPQRKISWQDYASLIKRIAVGLRSLGVAENDGVALLSHNDIYYYVLGDGVVAAGAIFAGIPTFVKEDELASCITAAQVKWLFVAAEFLELALTTAQSLGIDKSRVIVFDPPGLEPYCGPQPHLREILNADESLWQNPYCGKDPKHVTAFRLFTSGTTGSMKAAEISHASRLVRLGPTDSTGSSQDKRALHILGLYHIGGQYICNQACEGKVCAYISCADNAPTLLDQIQSFSITFIILPPRMMEAATAAIHHRIRSRETLHSLKGVVVGGTPSRTEAVKAFYALLPSHAGMLTGYGSTEAGPVTGTPAGPPWEQGYTGYVPPGGADIDVKIINPETLEKVSSGTEGEICVRSPFLFSGYCNNQAATDACFLPDEDRSWFRSGDKGYLAPNNGHLALTLTGRYKELFKVNLEEVAPVDVEDEIMRLPSVTDAAVTSTTARDNDADCECIAYVVRAQDSHVTAQQVVDHIASKMALHKVPTGGVVFCESIPRNGMGKVTRHRLVECQALPGSARYIDISIPDGGSGRVSSKL